MFFGVGWCGGFFRDVLVCLIVGFFNGGNEGSWGYGLGCGDVGVFGGKVDVDVGYVWDFFECFFYVYYVGGIVYVFDIEVDFGGSRGGRGYGNDFGRMD